MRTRLDTLRSSDREVLQPRRTKKVWVFFAIIAGWPIYILFSIVFYSIVLSLILEPFRGKHTKYCPWSHLMRDTAVCVVLDQHGDTVLIQHAELDINRYYLELRQGESSHFFKLPEGITRLAPSGYSAKLISGDHSAILLNGRFMQLQATQPSF